MSSESDFLPMVKLFLLDDPCTAIYHKYNQGQYDPATSEYATVQVDIPVQVLVQDLTRNSNGLSSVFGSEVLAGDRECYMLPPNKGSGFALPLDIDTTSDRITVGPYTYKVQNMKSADPTNINPILFQLLIRR